MSSIAPTSASTTTARLSASNGPTSPCKAGDDNSTPSHMLASAAATTAMPPPCGVGCLCEERAFGRAIA